VTGLIQLKTIVGLNLFLNKTIIFNSTMAQKYNIIMLEKLYISFQEILTQKFINLHQGKNLSRKCKRDLILNLVRIGSIQ